MSDDEYIHSMEREMDELRAWKRKYQEAANLWDALEAEDDQVIASAVLIGKLMKMEGTEEENKPTVSISATDDVDWMNQLGIIDAAYDFVHTDPWISRD